MKASLSPYFAGLLCLLSIAGHAQWTWLNPKPSGLTGKDITFIDQNTGFIINNAELLGTTDRGVTWRVIKAIPNGTRIKFGYGKGFVVGDYGTVYRSLDNGQTWTYLAAVATTESVNAVHILSDSRIYMTTATRLYKSSDGGTTFQATDIQYDNGNSWSYLQVKASAFTDEQTGHLACNDGLILKTKDGGATWYPTEQVNYFPSNFFTINFVNAQVGYATREHADIYKTTDGGESWQALPGASWGAGYGAYFISEDVGYVTGADGFVIKTIDGGSTWTWAGFQPGLYYGTAMNGLYFFNEQEGFAVGLRGRILKTSDGGKNWQPYSFTYNDINDVLFTDNNTGFIFSDRIYKTIDAGVSWAPVNTGLDEDQYYYRQGYMVTPQKLFAVSSNSYDTDILRSTDGGQTWTNTGINSTSISFVNESTGYAGGSTGVYKTTDGGATWTYINGFFSPGIIHFMNEDVGFATRYYNLYKTTDGGKNWLQVYGKDSGWFTDIDFVNAQVGYISAEQGLILKTTDGGGTWEELKTEYSDLNTIAFLNENVGFAVGEYGTNFTTEDGGYSWTSQYLQPQINALEFTPNGNLYAAGVNGALLRTTLAYGDQVLRAEDVKNVGAFSATLAGVAASNAGTLSNITLEYGSDYNFDKKVTLTPASLQAGKSKRYALAVTNLQPDTEYRVRMKATYAGGQVVSNVIQFKTLPEISLQMNFTFTNKPHDAQVSGQVRSNSEEITGIVFQYDTLQQVFRQSAPAAPDRADISDGNVYVTGALEGLKAGHTYYVRLKATHKGEDYYSELTAFTTYPDYQFRFNAPVVNGTSVALSATAYSYEFPITGMEYQYGLSRQYDQRVAGLPSGVNGFQNDVIQATVSLPLRDSVYYYRIKGMQNGAAIYSDENIVRLSGGLLLKSLPPKSIAVTEATLSGLLAAQGTYVYSVIFEYGATTAYGNIIQVTGISYYNYLNSTAALSGPLSNLTPETQYHYRLKAFAYDGKEYFSDDRVFQTGVVLGTADEAGAGVKVYPNPASSWVNLEHPVLIEAVDMVDIFGRGVYHAEPGAPRFSFDLSAYAPGVYYVVVQHQGKRVVRKFVKL